MSPTLLGRRRPGAVGRSTLVLEGILYADRYGGTLAQSRADHCGPTHSYYLDVPFEETVARHATKPIADDVSETQLRDWYRPRDLLPGGVETVISADSTLERPAAPTGRPGAVRLLTQHLPPVYAVDSSAPG